MQLDSRIDEQVRRALRHGHLVDLTTIGRRSAQPRRIELVFHAIDGRVILSGMPGRVRDWLLNIRANPDVVFHLKGPVRADLPARAFEITEPDDRRHVMERVARNWNRADVERMLAHSPLVEVRFDAEGAPAG